jgi:nicotinate-nucleotide adenylyltransferase
VFEKRRLDKLIFIPSNISPFKTGITTSSPEDRINMVKLAIEGFPDFEVSDIEIKNKGVSFTIDTLREFKNNYDNIDLIIGYDNILAFDKWKAPGEIFEIANVVVMKRSVDVPGKPEDTHFERAVFINTPLINISATEIRKRVANNLPIEELVPQKVNDYIVKNKLYRTNIL